MPLLHDDTAKKHNESTWCMATALDWLEVFTILLICGIMWKSY